MASRFHVSFTPPTAGWLWMHLGDESNECGFPCSYTPNDFLSELLGALSLALQGAEGRALAFSEPTTHELLISPPDADGSAELRVIEHRGIPPHGREGRIAATFHLDARALVLAFCRALRRLETEVSPPQYLAAMRTPFPTDKLAALFALAKGNCDG
ncbi:MAG TPA: hypothetical protein VGE52_07465 [Pirellulales bacterium]